MHFSKSKNKIRILCLLTPLVLIGIGIFIILSNAISCRNENQTEHQVNTNEKEKQLALLQQKEQEQLEQETADWLVYRNEEFGYQLKYPNRWRIIEADSGYKGTDLYRKLRSGQLQALTFLERSSQLVSSNIEGELRIFVKSNLEKLNLEQWIENIGNENVNSVQEFNLGGMPAKIIDEFGYVETYILIRTIYNNYKLTIMYSIDNNAPNMTELLNIYNKMIKTFQFIK